MHQAERAPGTWSAWLVPTLREVQQRAGSVAAGEGRRAAWRPRACDAASASRSRDRSQELGDVAEGIRLMPFLPAVREERGEALGTYMPGEASSASRTSSASCATGR